MLLELTLLHPNKNQQWLAYKRRKYGAVPEICFRGECAEKNVGWGRIVSSGLHNRNSLRSKQEFSQCS